MSDVNSGDAGNNIFKLKAAKKGKQKGNNKNMGTYL